MKSSTVGNDTRQRAQPANVNADWPENGLETLGACPVCQSSRRSILHEGLRDNVFFCAPGRWTMWRCDECRSAYLDPRPTPETIHLAYTEYYTHAPKAPKPDSEQLSWLLKIRRAMANGYRKRRYGTVDHPASTVGHAVALVVPSLRRPLDVAFRFLPHPASTGRRRVLDVGFGSGQFLDLASSAGWNAFGCDPDPVAVANARARGHIVREGGVETWSDAEGSFDAVTLSHVIEHVHDPADVLRAIYRLLGAGGFLYIETPNIEALGHKEYGRSWRGLEPPRHIVILNWGSCNRLLDEIGYSAIDPKTRRNVISSLGLKSAKISLGVSPYADVPASAPGAILRLRSRLTHRNSEFITLTCRKPI